MLKSRLYLCSYILFLFPAYLTSQEYPTGLLLDKHLYTNSLVTPQLRSLDFTNLPLNMSLEKYTPPPASQNGLSTCAGWAVSYYARSILEAIKFDYSGRYIELNTFSPSFIYNQIRPDTGCYWGVSLTDALDVLKEIGSLKFSNFKYDCSREVREEEIKSASRYKIKEYREIFSRSGSNKTNKVKKSIAEKKPVVIAMDCPPSFKFAGEIWKPQQKDYQAHNIGHAVTVIGYDDMLNGGSFLVINSWGDNWGINGKTWIKYTDFDYFTYYAFELIDFPSNSEYSLSGELRFISEMGSFMPCSYNGKYFEMDKSYSSGTKFQVYLTNENPAFVYVFSTDLKNNIYKIFPPDKRTSAYLPYQQSNLALPDEFHYNMLDEVKGKSYYIFLYSKNELDINKIIQESSDGNVYKILEKYFGYIEENIIISEGNSIRFRSNKSDSIVYFLIEFKHI